MAPTRERSTYFADALSGVNGMDDPMPSPFAVEVLADPTALPSVVNVSVSVSSRPLPARPLTAVPVPPSRQPPTGPAFIAPAPPLFTRSAAPVRRNPQPAMRAGPMPPGPRRAPNAAGSYAPTPYAQQFAQPPAQSWARTGPPPPRPVVSPPYRPGQPGQPRQTAQSPAVSAQLRQQALADRSRQRRPPKKKSGWGGVFVLLVFVFLFLLGSGLFAKIVDAIEQVLHR